MRVIATEGGFYKGARIREGREFDVPEGTKGKWFVATAPVEKPKADAKPVKAAPVEKPKADAKASAPADDLT
jgi:hypothetical protein